jgi:putative membrane protein
MSKDWRLNVRTLAGAIAVAGAVAGAVAAAGCSHQPPQAGTTLGAPAARAVPAAPAASPLSAADRELVMQMAQGGQYEVEVGRLAARRAASGAVRSYAQTLVNHHEAVNKELALLLEAKNLPPPQRLPADMQARLKHLQPLAGTAFDREFIRLAGIEDHRANLALFQRAARDAVDADVKAWAARTLPTLRGHLQQAQALAATLTG